MTPENLMLIQVTPHNAWWARLGLCTGSATLAGRMLMRIALATILLGSTAAATAQEIAIEQPAGTNLIGNRVVGFGYNASGQVTIPTTLTGVIAIEAGGDSSAALKIDGTVVGWGQFPVPAVTGVQAITLGGVHGHGLRADGTLVNWGNITAIPNGLGNRAVSAGLGWSAALQTSTGIITWGQNLPSVPAETGFVGLAAGDFHLLALRNNGTVAAYGNNSNGQQLVPSDLSGVTAVAAGFRFSLALLSNGSVRGWGFNDNGGGGNVVVPAGLNNVAAIAANGHALALKNDGTVVGWGRGVEGQLTLPAGSGPARAIAAGGYHSLALVGNTLSYAPQLLGSTSVAKTFVIKNTGSSALTISGINLFGAQTGDFAINTAGMLSSVPAGGQTNFSVRFTPTAVGERRTMLRVSNNDSDEASFETLLDGSGFTAPEIAVFGNNVGINDGDSTPSLTDFTDFGDVPLSNSAYREYQIQNLGNGALNLGAITFSGAHASDFFVTSLSSSSVPIGGSGILEVRFTPAAPGVRQARIQIANNDLDENPFDFALQGLGPNLEIAVSSEGSDIADGGSGVDFGELDLNELGRTRRFTVRNEGFGTMTLGQVSLQGGQDQAFTVLNPLPATLGSNASVTFDVRFAPSGPGTYGTTLSFANSDADEDPFDFPIRGTVVAVEIAVSGNGVDIVDGDSTPSAADFTDFGSTDTSGEMTREFVIRNTGIAGALTLGPVSITGASDFLLRDAPATSLAPGASTTLRLAFAPTARGVRNAVVSIANNDANEHPFDFAIRASATAPEIVVERQGTVLQHALVRAWGSNAVGQLSVPSGLMGVVELDGGFGHTLARKADGTVGAWGQNDFGQATVPPGLRGVIAISASRWHSLALRADGTVVAWGRCNSGQCNVSNLRNITAIAAGDEQTFALKSDGTVLAFGANYFGQMDVPAGLSSVVGIAAGYGHTLALKSDGTVVCWGRNQELQCVPQNLSGITAIAAGFQFSIARRPDGTLAAWGTNDNQELGGAVALQGVAAFALGTHHGLARSIDGVLMPWGLNVDGQASVPADIAPNAAATVGAIGGGDKHSVAAINPGLLFAPGEHGAANAKVLTLRNAGLDPLAITSINLMGSDASDFSLDASAVPSVLNPGAQASISVRSNATGGESRRAGVRIRNGDADEGTFDIALNAEFSVEMSVTGNGVEIANGDSTPDLADHTDFGSTAYPSNFTRTFTIHNLGTGTLRLAAPTLEFPSYFSIVQAPPASIPGGGSATFKVRFTPLQGNGIAGNSIRFTSNDADESPFSFALKAQFRLAGPGDISGAASDVIGDAVWASATQGSGHILIGGEFSQVHGQPRQNLARLNPDGSLDTTFNPGANGAVRSIAALPGGQFLVGGDFTMIAGAQHRYVARFNANGSLDTSFDPNPSAAVDQVLVDHDDRILLSGNFTTLQPNSTGTPISRPYLARVLASGAVDTAFNPAPDARVRTLALQDNGRIVLGGDFQGLAPNGGAVVARGRIARIGNDGALDGALNVSVNASVRSVAIMASGFIVLGGDFTTLTPNSGAAIARPHVAMLNADGSVQSDFNPAPNGPVWTTVLSSDQYLYLGGSFNRFEPSSGPVYERVGFGMSLADGFVFNIVANAGLASGNPLVAAIALGADGKMLLGGRFESFTTNGDPLPTARANLARLRNFTSNNQLRVLPAGNGFYWSQEGGGPSLQRASFDMSTDGGSTWISLGNGVRFNTSPSFQVQTSTPIPDVFKLRARGTAAAGASTSQIEQITDFDFFAGPKVELRGNTVVINNFDSTPSPSDHTDFGGISTASGFIERIYTIKNIGAMPLTMAQVQLGNLDFSVQNTPANVLAPGASTQLQIRFDPSADGLRTSLVRFYSTDPLANPFDFTIQGEGLGNLPSAPTILSATPLSGGARISFSAATTGGGPILDYTAACMPGTASTSQNALSIDVTGLSNNTVHRCSVRGRNAAGLGPSSAALSVIPGSSGSSADLSISKSNGTNFVNGAAPVDYLIVVTNAGPAGVIGARVSDTIGAGTDFGAATWQCTALNGAACPSTLSGSGALDAMVDLPNAASVQFLFSALPNAAGETPISNVASVTLPAAITDPNLGNNVASDGPDIRGVFRTGFE